MSLADTLTKGLGKAAKNVRILTLDIENLYATLEGFDIWNQNFPIDRIREPVRTICVATKWLGKPAEVVTEWDAGEKDMLLAVHKAMSDADVIVGYNSDGFDFKHLNWQFARHSIPRPRPFKSIDLLKVVRREFKPMSKRLDFVAQQLGVGKKVEHEGFGLWQKVAAGDPDARSRMVEYAAGDVELTERLYLRLLGWLPASVNLPLIGGADDGCPNCGGKLRASGTTFTAQTEYGAYMCRRCGAWARANFIKSRTAKRIIR